MEREDKVRDMQRLKLAGCTYDQIGKKYGITRQRVQQLISPPPQVKRHIIEKYHGICCLCNLEIGTRGDIHHKGSDIDTFNDIDSLELLCISCHLHVHGANGAKARHKTCENCGKDYWRTAVFGGMRGQSERFCSQKCRSEYIRIDAVCDTCGKVFRRQVSWIARNARGPGQNHIFCSKQCQGRWLGKTHQPYHPMKEQDER